jgi:hypothetical protein
MKKFKLKYIGWFLLFLKWCIRDILKYPKNTFWKRKYIYQNWTDFKTKIIFDSDETFSSYSRTMVKIINHRQKHR